MPTKPTSIWLSTVENPDEQVRGVVEHLLRRGDIREPHEPALRLFRLLNHPFYQSRGIPLCLDIGANQGHSVVSLSRLCPRLRVISFEPLPVCVTSLRYLQTQSHRLPRDFEFSIEPVALSSKDGMITLWAPGSETHVVTTRASFKREEVVSTRILNLLNDTLFNDAPLNQITAHRIDILAKALDGYGLSPDGIKMDVELHEAEVLRGAWDTLERCKPMLSIETGPHTIAIKEMLAPLGYALFAYDEEAKVFRPDGAVKMRGNPAFMTGAQADLATEVGLLSR